MKVHLLLKKYLEKKKGASKSFSIRLIARELDVSPSFLSRIFSGKKALPFSMLKKLKILLDIEDEVYEILREKYDTDEASRTLSNRTDVSSALQEWELAGKPTFQVLRQWFYLPILECTTLKNYDGSLKMIADRLSISEVVVEVAVREMISLNLMKIVEGRYFKARKKIRWGAAKSVSDIRSFHSQMMTKAQVELREKTGTDDFSKRLITGITVTASPKKIMAAKKKLSEALHEIANDLTSDNGTEVYQLSAQLFPLTR